MFRRLTFAFVLLLTSLGYAHDPPWFPLGTGNVWKYNTSLGQPITMRVVGTERVQGVECAIMEVEMGGAVTREYLAVTAEGLTVFKTEASGSTLKYDVPLVRVRLPFREGDSWTAVVHDESQDARFQFHSDGLEKVRVPAGTYDCIKVSSVMTSANGSLTMVNWYAQGTGLVKQMMSSSGTALIAELAETTVRPAARTLWVPGQHGPGPERACPRCGTAAQPGAKFCVECGAPLAEPKCAQCGAPLAGKPKFCPACGAPIAPAPAPAPVPDPDPVPAPDPGSVPGDDTTAAPAPTPGGAPQPPAPSPAGGPKMAFQRYESSDGRVLLYHPLGWKVDDTAQTVPNAYVLQVQSPDQNAGVLFLALRTIDQINDSVELAEVVLSSLRRQYPDLQVTTMKTTQDRTRTSVEATATEQGVSWASHWHFFRTARTATLYALLARSDRWQELLPTLTAILANLAYAPEGVASVLHEGREAAARAGRPPEVDGIRGPAAGRGLFPPGAERTTLDQATWVAEREGASVTRSPAWGLPAPERAAAGAANPWHVTKFTGPRPRALDPAPEIDTRAEWETFIHKH